MSDAKCVLCGEPVKPRDEKTWKKVTGWVGGPRRDSMKMRQDTGEYAHDECIKAEQAGIPATTPDLFEEPAAPSAPPMPVLDTDLEP